MFNKIRNMKWFIPVLVILITVLTTGVVFAALAWVRSDNDITINVVALPVVYTVHVTSATGPQTPVYLGDLVTITGTLSATNGGDISQRVIKLFSGPNDYASGRDVQTDNDGNFSGTVEALSSTLQPLPGTMTVHAEFDPNIP